MPTYHDPEDGDPTTLAQLEANAVIMDLLSEDPNIPAAEAHLDKVVDNEGMADFLGVTPCDDDDLPVLVYRTRHMTDEQAAAIQDFAHKVMSHA